MEIKTNIYSPKDDTIALYERELDSKFQFKATYQDKDYSINKVYKYSPEFKQYATYNTKIGKYKIPLSYIPFDFHFEVEPTKIVEEISNSGGSSDYYKLPPNSTELQDLIEFKNMNYAIANIFKACYRYGENHHSSKMRDMEKAVWFANREIARLKKS